MIGRRSFLIVANNGIGTLFGFVGLFFVFRYMDKDAYGMFVATFALVGIFAMLTQLGFNNAHIRHVASGRDEAAANGAFLAIKFLLILLFLATGSLAYAVWTLVLGQGFTQATTPFLLLLMTIAYTVGALRQYFDFTFRGHRRIALGETVSGLDSLVTAAGFVTAAQVFRLSRGGWVPFSWWGERWLEWLGVSGPLSVEHGAALLTASFMVGTTVSFVLAAAIFVSHRYPIGRPTLALMTEYRRFAMPVALVSVMALLAVRVDTVLLAYFWFVEDAADYRAASKLLGPALVFGAAVWALLFPTVSKLQQEGRLDEAARSMGQAERYLSMLLMGILMLAVVFTREGLVIVSSQAYVSAAPTLQILTVFALFQTLLMPSKAYLMGTNQPGSMARVGGLVLGLVVVLDILLIPSSILGVPLAGLRAPGAAIGTAAAVVAGYVYVKALVRRQIRSTSWLPTGFERHVAAAVGSGLIMAGARDVLGPTWFDRFWELGLTAAVGLALYAALLVALRGFGRKDWAFMMDLLHPGRMGSYMAREFRGHVREDA